MLWYFMFILLLLLEGQWWVLCKGCACRPGPFSKDSSCDEIIPLHSFFMYINVVCRSQAEYSYFSVNFRLEIFLNYF